MTAVRLPTVLVVDDDRTNITILAHLLDTMYDVLFATNGPQALELAAMTRPDAILLDVMMPEMNGYEVLVKLKANPVTASIPVIFLTGLDASAAETRGFELGAADYITKPFNALVVKARVRNQVELKQTRDKLHRLASIDGLTGVANRRTFDEDLRRECQRAAQGASPLALVMIDVDAFKAYNDTYGHVAGDECLRHLAEVLAGSLQRTTDVLARYGGEEFACLLPDTDVNGALTVTQRMLGRLAERAIPHSASPAGPYVTASFGVTGMPGGMEVTDPLALVRAADAYLYAAKFAGRNVIRHGAVDVAAEARR